MTFRYSQVMGAGQNYEVFYEFFFMKYFSKCDLQDLFNEHSLNISNE